MGAECCQNQWKTTRAFESEGFSQKWTTCTWWFWNKGKISGQRRVIGFKGMEWKYADELCECGTNETEMHMLVEWNRLIRWEDRWGYGIGLDEKERTMDVIKCYVEVNDVFESDSEISRRRVDWTRKKSYKCFTCSTRSPATKNIIS